MAGNQVNGALHNFMSSQNRKCLKRHDLLYIEEISFPHRCMGMYGSECWVWQKKHESRLNAVEMRSLRRIAGVKLMDRMRNSVMREHCGMIEDVVTKIEKGTLRWFGHVERMDEGSLAKQIYEARVNGQTGKG